MENCLIIKDNIVIPLNEIEISTSRAGGPGGQHVNKTDTRITVRWNIFQTQALDFVQKEHVLQNLHSRLTLDGDLIIHNGASRSQQQNKEMALVQLAETIRKALHVPKKRMATKASRAAKRARLETKAHRGIIKKLRGNKNFDD